MKVSSILTLLLISNLAISADVFYVDPENGSSTGDGSEANPWKTLQEVFEGDLIETRAPANLPYSGEGALVTKNDGAPVKSGDTITLLSGYHGEIDYTTGYNDGVITIEAKPGHTPRFKSITLRAAGGWVLRGLSISPSFAPVYEEVTAVEADSHAWFGPAHDIVVENCFISSVEDISTWSVDDWNTLAINGIALDGDRCVARSNWLRNVNFGIIASGDDCLVEYNTIENFSGDGIRGLGDASTYQYNVVKNCYDVNDNHDDGFQSWSVGEGGVGTGVVKDVTLRGNTFINYTDPNQLHRGTLQAIGCFDGFFENWVVENNVILIDHWHGITFLGAINCKVVNNTVLDLNEQRPGPPWILVGAHKNDIESTGCIIRNNLSTAFSGDTSSGPTMLVDHNTTISDPDDHFVDYAAGDLRLKPSSSAIDAGTSAVDLSTDLLGVPRTEGVNPDAGAFEYTADSDNDGMPNWWEQKHFQNSTAGIADADEDSDGETNLSEYLTATDPKDGSSKLSVVIRNPLSGEVSLTWPGQFGRVYRIEKSADLSFDTPLENVTVPSMPPFNHYTLPLNGEDSAFYRVRVFPHSHHTQGE